MKNLLYNPSFELWTYPNSAPDGWDFMAYSGTTANVSRSTSAYVGNYSAKITSPSSGSAYLGKHIVSSVGLGGYVGKSFTVGGWIWSDTGSARLEITDNVVLAASSWHPGDGQWHWMQVTRTLQESSTWAYLVLRVYGTGIQQVIVNFDGAVALEGCWVPQTPFAFEDVEYRLGPTSATSIPLYPDEGMELGKYLMHNTQRAADGHLYGYEFGTYHKSSFPVQFMPASDAAIVNSWWESQAKLLLFVTSGPVTAVHSCMIMGESSPMNQVNKPYDDRFKGTIPLEGY